MSALLSVRGEFPGSLGSILAALLALGAPPGVAQVTEAHAQAAPGALAVASEPAGASVYLDGQYRGTTPIELGRLARGDHRVKLTKAGYLENSRLVSLASGEVGRIQVQLTARPALQVEPGAEPSSRGGGGSTKWLLIGLGAVAAGAGVFLATRDTNKGPSAGAITVTPTETGLASATSFGFTSTASDPDNGPSPLSYSWEFGDGASGSGVTASHTYAAAGTFAVKVTVSDGKQTAEATASVTVRDLAGHWAGAWSVYDFTMDLTQNGASVFGHYQDMDGMGSVSGHVSGPRDVELTVVEPPFAPFTFTGTADAAVNMVSGQVAAARTIAFSMRRQ